MTHPTAFVVHTPHPMALSRKVAWTGPLWQEMQALFERVVEEIKASV